MSGRLIPLALALALGAWSLHGATLTTTFAGASSDAPADVTVVAQRVDGIAQPVELKVSVPGTSDLALSEGLWEVRVTGDAMWAAPVHIRNVDSANVRLWPTMLLQGTANDTPKLRAQFAPSDGDGAAGEVACVVTKDNWTCRLPVGRYDVRFSSPGMAPEFRSGVSAESKGADLALRFVAGASLYGWVDAETPVEGARVSLQGHGVQHVTPADAKGFFQFKGLAPGDYVVAARRKDLVAPARAVKVLAGVAAEIRERLHLDTPKQLTILVMPPLDPDGERWRLRVSPAKSGQILTEERVPEIGQWSRSGFVAGSYDVELLDARGGQWHSETVAVASDDRIVPLSAWGTTISGRVTFGGRALGQARLSFGGEGGRVLQADDDGRFAGHIPTGDRGERLIFVEANTPYVNRSVRAEVETDETGDAHLLIDLPATTLMGRVLNEDRSPAQAVLKVTGVTDSDSFEQAFTEPDGTFQVAGLDPGTYQVAAEASEQKSDLLKFDLTANEPREVEIILKDQEVLRGKMTVGETPVIAARILAIPRDAAWSTFLPQTTTNERGMFQLRLPPGTTIFDGIVVHPAFDTMMARGSVRPDRVVWVQASQIGGTLIVKSPNPHELVLRHKDAELPISTVAWMSDGIVGADQATLTRLEPGEYAVCSFDKTSCASGYLPPHGALTLTPKR